MRTTMRWSKAKMRGQSGNGEEINKMMNRLLYLLVLLHPREIAQEKQEVTFKTSLERKLSERCRESKNSLVSEQNKRYLKLKYATSDLWILCRGGSVKRRTANRTSALGCFRMR